MAALIDAGYQVVKLRLVARAERAPVRDEAGLVTRDRRRDAPGGQPQGRLMPPLENASTS